MDMAVKIGLRFTMPYIRSVYAFALARNGDLGKARTVFEGCIAQTQETGETAHLAEIHRLYGEAIILDDVSNKEEATNHLASGLKIARQQSAQGWVERIQKTAADHGLSNALAP